MKENISIKKYTTFKIGCNAKYFVKVKNKEEMEKAVKEIKRNKTPFFILGGGSNILVNDKGYKGTIIKINNKKIEVKKNKIFVEGGTSLNNFVNITIENSLTGLEWAAGIPGTVGGAIYGNAAAFGFSIKDTLESVEVFNIEKESFEKIEGKGFSFENKESIFKKNKNLVIFSAVFKLKKGKKEKIKEKIEELILKRKKSHPVSLPSAGCIFKNYEGKVFDKKLIEEFPLLEKFNNLGVIPVSYLIEKANLKGKKIGGAKISNKHANFIVNEKNAKKKDVEDLIKIIKKEVKKKFKIKIEEEVQKL